MLACLLLVSSTEESLYAVSYLHNGNVLLIRASRVNRSEHIFSVVFKMQNLKEITKCLGCAMY